ncbi:MAG: hypothetical protein BWY79_02221 [Actinobacteria bacterium ADurb.Bin444]|nr:MAG: hypothetical protein BWY79_02221 [Actinobacteria bacterium ADurb.Bin444]
MTTGRRPRSISTSAKKRDVWLLPAPVRVEHTDMTGTSAFTMVASVPNRVKSAPAAKAREAWCITYSCDTSL